MKKRYGIYDHFMPDTKYDNNSAEDVIALLEAHTEGTLNKGTNLILRNSTYVSETRQINITPIETDKLTPYHRHEFYEINYVVSGRVGQHIDGKSFILEEGELLFMSPNVYHIAFPVGSETIAYNVLLHADFVEHEISKMKSYSANSYLQQLAKNPIYFVFKNTEEFGFSNIIKKLDNTVTNSEYYKPYVEMLRRNLAENMLTLLNYAEKHSVSYQPPKIDLDKDERNKRIVQYILDNYTTVTLEEVSKYFSFSTQQIRRIVKETTGITFAENIRCKRINKARHYLIHTDMSVAQIAKHVGLDSPEYFSRRFKNDMGVTPLEYRSIMHKKNSSKEGSQEVS